MWQLKAPNPLLLFFLIGILVLAAAAGIFLNATHNPDGQEISAYPWLQSYPPPARDALQNFYPAPRSLSSGNQATPGIFTLLEPDVDRDD